MLIASTIATLYFIKGTWAKIVLGGVLAILLTAFGMEATNHDYDVQKLAQTKSFAVSKIDYNCADFKTQAEAMEV